MKNSLPFLLLFLFCLPCFGQEYAISVQHLTIEDGLSNRFVNSVFQDSKGFLWISTNNGVNRWDGYEMKVFAEHSPVQEVMEDDAGRIWFQYGLSDDSFYDKPHKFLVHHSPLGKDSLQANEWRVVANLNGTILLESLTNGMIYTYTDQLIPHPKLTPFFKEKTGQYAIAISDDRFWLKAYLDFYLLDWDGVVYERDSIRSPFNEIRRFAVKGDTLYYSCYESLIERGERKNVYHHFLKKPGHLPEVNPQFKTEVIPRIFTNGYNPPFSIKAKNGITWEMRLNQLKAKDKNGNLIFDLHDYLSQQNIAPKFLLDRQDNAWISTDNGVYRISITPSYFESFLNDNNPTYSTRGILLLNDSLLVHTYLGSKMVALSDGGVSPLENTVKNFGIAVGNFLDEDGLLYWGEGKNTTLTRYNLRTKELQHLQNKSYTNGLSYLPYRDKKSGTLWLSGTTRLLLLNEHTSLVEEYLFEGEEQPIDIRHFFEDEQGLWIVARNGLFLTDPVTRKILTIFSEENNTLPCNQFNYIHKDAQGIFWLATQGFGLIRWNPEDGSYKIFGRNDGFLSMVIYCVYEDHHNRLWLPTEYGLVLFDKETESVHVFLKKDGLTHNEFNGFSHHQGTDGRFYFGGLNGLIAFHPDSIFITQKTNNIPLHLTSVKIPGNNNTELTDITKEIQQTHILRLQPNNNSFTVEFAYLDFDNHLNIDYAYQIEGLDKDWTYQRPNFIRFTGLPSGHYKLHIKAKGKSNNWSTHQITLPIHVLKPFYLEWYFIGMVLLLVGLLLYIFFRYRTYRLRRSARILEKRVALRTETILRQKDDLEQLNQTKSRLYAIIAHDLRDPVEAFKGFASKINFLLEKKDMSHVIRLSNFIENSAAELSKLLENLLQWAQLQQKDLPYKPAHYNIENLIKECFGSLQAVATNKSIKLEYQGIPGLEIHGDYHMLTTIFRNLIDNALKFSHPKSSIIVKARTVDQKVEISFQDFGVGMTPEQQDRLFTIKMEATSEGTQGERGTGLGLPLCKELLKVHGAEVSVSSVRGEGTVVALVF